MKNWVEKIGQIFQRVFFFFPIQLFFVHLKKNIVLLLIWAVIFSITFQVIGNKYGVPTLFLAPEYLGQVSFSSFLIFGFAVGGFVLSFNLFSYVMNGFRFPFLVTISRPFYKYSLNNALIPFSYIISYIFVSAHFQLKYELIPQVNVLMNLAGFILGYLLFNLIGHTYFITTNKSIYKTEKKSGKVNINPVQLSLHKRIKWDFGVSNKQWFVATYLSSPFKIMLTRDFSHYKPEMIGKIFRQNRFNASVFQLLAIISFIVIGLFRANPVFVIPAGASLMLLFTIVIMIFSAIHSWIRGWSTVVIIALLFGINYISKYDYLKYENKAYGVNYKNKKPVYSAEHIHQMAFDTVQHQKDIEANIYTLKKWKARQADRKPKIVFIATSGGGSRSALWTFCVLRRADSLLNGKLLNSTYLITGSSGGMIGAAFMRALYNAKKHHKIRDYYAQKYVNEIGTDLLNPIVFSIAVNDLFIRTQRFKYNNIYYLKDRGFAFEHQLNINTNYLMDKQLKDIKDEVKNAQIPAMVFTPTIINDGRKLYISEQAVSFLSDNAPDSSVNSFSVSQGIDFEQLFGQKQLDNLRLTSAVRMGASFPYILPSVSLPTNPKINVMDAGVRDNYGISTTVHYIYALRHWLEKNTSGIIILSIRDSQKGKNMDLQPLRSLSQTMFSPLGSFYGNLFSIQDFTDDQYVQYLSAWYKGDIDILDFQLDYSNKNPISLSFHLTSNEKKETYNSLEKPNNQETMHKLIRILEK